MIYRKRPNNFAIDISRFRSLVLARTSVPFTSGSNQPWKAENEMLKYPPHITTSPISFSALPPPSPSSTTSTASAKGEPIRPDPFAQSRTERPSSSSSAPSKSQKHGSLLTIGLYRPTSLRRSNARMRRTDGSGVRRRRGWTRRSVRRICNSLMYVD